MFHRLANYPFSILIVAVVLYLSFFTPPSTDDLPVFEGMDKLVHFGMYFGLSGVLWLEYRKAHRLNRTPLWHAWTGAFLCPLLLSGLVEILQAYCTTDRSGEWLDFAANLLGVAVASVIGYSLVRRRCVR